MLDLFKVIIVIAFIARTIRQIFYQVFLWQLKEYRVDRFWSFLKSEQGKKFIFSPILAIKLVLLFNIYGLSLINIYAYQIENLYLFIIYSFYLFWFIWVVEFIIGIRDIYLKKWKFPKFTFKICITILIVFYVELSGIINSYWTFPLLFGPFLDVFLIIFVSLTVFLVNIPAFFYKKIIYLKAAKKIKRMGVKVIGITGSFGKTSTKEFLYQILVHKYTVAKTPGSFNTDIGIAVYINKNLNKSDFFIVEMGAYKRGEINKICKLVNPKIAIITGVGNQHLELFGSIKNLISAKYELIKNLPYDGFAVFNSRSPGILSMAEMAKDRISNVYLSNTDKDIKSLNISRDKLEFDLKINTKKINFKTSLAGKQHLDNLLLAIKTALILNVPVQIIRKAVLNIKSPERTMRILKNGGRTVFIDDTFNVNYEGVISAVEYLKLYNGKKVLFLNPIIELGNEGANIHKRIGKEIGETCDYLFVTNVNYFKELKEGVNNSKRRLTKIYVAREDKVKNIIKSLNTQSVVLFAGKESYKWAQILKVYEHEN